MTRILEYLEWYRIRHKPGLKTWQGFVNSTDSVLAMDGADFTIAPVGVSYDVYFNGRKNTKLTLEQVTISNDQALHFVYFTPDGTLTASTTPWSLTGVNVPVATVFKDGSIYALASERHGYRRSLEWHEWAHDNIGALWHDGYSGTFGNTTFSLGQGVIADEDLEFDSGSTRTDCRLWYRNAALTSMRTEAGISTPWKSNAGAPQYDNAGTMTNVGANRYFCSYFYGTNDQDYPVYLVSGQYTHTTLAAAQSESLPAILLNVAEWKLLYRVIYRQSGGSATWIETADFRKAGSGPASTYIPTDHASLANRSAANSHPATAISNTPAGNISATTVQAAIDELDTEKAAVGAAPTAHAASHNAGGSDALAIDAVAGTGSLRTLGTSATSACAGNDARLSDARTPTAHAATHTNGTDDIQDATAAQKGLATSTQITKLDGIAAGADVTGSNPPQAHAASHKSGGSDAIKLDELAAPTDVTTLNASTSAHGLCPKLSNVATEFLNGQGSFSTPAGGSSLPRGYIDGCIIQNDATDPSHDINLLAGVCRDSTNQYDLATTGIFTKQLDGSWAIGSGVGAMDTGSIAAASWYHIWIIRRDSDATIDWLASLSATAPTMPVGWTAKRRVGSVLTDGSANIIPFTQFGDQFLWSVPVTDANAVAVGTTAILVTLSVPTGIKVFPLLSFSYMFKTAVNIWGFFSSPDVTDTLPAAVYASTHYSSFPGWQGVNLRTNTSGQIRARSNTAGSALYLITAGWTDPRGQNE